MKTRNTFGTLIDATLNTGITVTAGAAGAAVAAYSINHDVLNDPDMSAIVGAAGGIGTFCVVRGALRTVKDGTISTARKVKTKLSRKSKTNSTT